MAGAAPLARAPPPPPAAGAARGAGGPGQSQAPSRRHRRIWTPHPPSSSVRPMHSRPDTSLASRPGSLAAAALRQADARPRVLLVLACLLLWLPGFLTLPPSDRDESRFAQATKQMVETGDYLRIMNGTEARNRKPIGIYWMQAPFALVARATGLAGGNPIWPYRVPSLLGGLVAVLATFELGLLATDRRSALLAAAMLAACPILVMETHIAKTDAALLGATTLAMLPLARAWLAPGTLRRGGAALFWLALGAGILLKGPLTPMVTGLAALGLAASSGRWRWLGALRFGWGVPLMLAVVLPWFAAIGVTTHGAFFRDALGGDLAGKLHGGDDAHGAFPGTHLLLLPLLALPAFLPMLRALPDAWRDRRDDVTRLLLAWILPAWLVFELVPTKLPHYTLPLYPALCLLGARWVGDATRRSPPAWLRRLSAGLFLAAAALLGLAAALLPLILARAAHQPLPRSWWLGVPALAAAALLGWAGLHRRGPAGVLGALLAAVPLCWAVLGLELPRQRPLWIAPRAEALLEDGWPRRNPLGVGLDVVGYAEPSLMFLAGTALRELGSAQAGAQALADGQASAVLVGDRDVDAFTHDAAALGVRARAAGSVSGLNYSRGRAVTLTLFVR